MRLWTIQTEDIYELLNEKGVYHCEPKLSLMYERSGNKDSCFFDAYSWMYRQMKSRVGNAPEGVEYPVWAWHTWDKRHIRPDLRINTFWPVDDSVLMEIEVPDEQVLLSDEESWHFVLNKWCIYDLKNSSWEREDERFESLSESEKEEVMVKSWEKIFEIKFPETGSKIEECTADCTSYVQATFWELKLENVIKVWKVKGRYKSESKG